MTRNRIAAATLLAAGLALASASAEPAPAPSPANSGGLAPAAPTPPASQPPGSSSTLNENATEVDSTTSTTLDYLFNHKAGEGSAAKAGADVAGAIADKIKAVDVLKTPGLDDPALRARFETFLSLKEVPQARIDEYFGKMKQISEMLKASPNPDTFGAWKLLYSLSDYDDLDAGISKELASRVENFWNTDRTKNGLEAANDNLRNQAEAAVHNGDMDAQELKYQEEEDRNKAKSTKGASNNNSASNATNSALSSPDADPAAAEAAVMPTMGASLQGKLEMTSDYLNLLESRFKIKLNEIREHKLDDQDRQDFADYIKTLYQDHRYYHVLIAADFYRAIFNDGDYPSDLTNQAVASGVGNGRTAAQGAQQISKTLGVNNGAVNAMNQASGILGGSLAGGGAGGTDQQQPVTIPDMVTSADEINERVTQAIEVFRYKADKGEIASAADELQEAFVGNEFHPALKALPRDEKEKVGDFLTKLDVLKNQLEVRDFEQVEGQIGAIQKIATDFDATKPMALVNAIKLEARLRLGKARLLAQAENLTAAMQEFQTAAEEWPGNPDLNSSANTFFKSENTMNEASGDFDRLEQDQNYRAIFDRQLEFAIAVKGDTTREQQLKDALEKVGKAKVAEEKANALVLAGDVDGAWETIEIATKDWPDDVKLNKMLADLSERGADFVSALNKARQAEAKKELGYSLTWYVNAQGLYPASTLANDGIDRVSKLILNPPSADNGGSGAASTQ